MLLQVSRYCTRKLRILKSYSPRIRSERLPHSEDVSQNSVMQLALHAAAILIAFTIAGKPAEKQPSITVEPAESLVDETVRIGVSGLSAGQPFTICSSMLDALGRRWSGEMTATARPDSSLDVSRWAPPGSKYQDIEPMRPFWSMRLDSPAEAEVFVRPVSESIEVSLEVKTEHGKMAATKATRYLTSPSVRMRDVREDGLVGRMYEPSGSTQRLPAVLVFASRPAAFRTDMRACSLLTAIVRSHWRTKESIPCRWTVWRYRWNTSREGWIG